MDTFWTIVIIGLRPNQTRIDGCTAACRASGMGSPASTLRLHHLKRFLASCCRQRRLTPHLSPAASFLTLTAQHSLPQTMMIDAVSECYSARAKLWNYKPSNPWIKMCSTCRDLPSVECTFWSHWQLTADPQVRRRTGSRTGWMTWNLSRSHNATKPFPATSVCTFRVTITTWMVKLLLPFYLIVLAQWTRKDNLTYHSFNHTISYSLQITIPLVIPYK